MFCHPVRGSCLGDSCKWRHCQIARRYPNSRMWHKGSCIPVVQWYLRDIFHEEVLLNTSVGGPLRQHRRCSHWSTRSTRSIRARRIWTRAAGSPSLLLQRSRRRKRRHMTRTSSHTPAHVLSINRHLSNTRLCRRKYR